jgi:hypothetical protein
MLSRDHKHASVEALDGFFEIFQPWANGKRDHRCQTLMWPKSNPRNHPQTLHSKKTAILVLQGFRKKN